MGSGPLSGVTVLEIAGIGPGPFCAMLLSDMGADVIRIDRKNANPNSLDTGKKSAKFDFTGRGRRSIAVDLKSPEGIEMVLKLAEKADIIQEGFRPGVMERLGLGPDVLLKRNPKIVYGRMTGWGQFGPLAHAAGHDVNYACIAGAIAAVGPKDGKPVPPLNIFGDYGGGALYLAMGMLAAVIEARSSGKGQVVDAAMSDGVASLCTTFYGMVQGGSWNVKERQSNILDGGAPVYDIYETSDGKYISIASMEPQFYKLLRQMLKLEDSSWDKQLDKSVWPEQKAKITEIFKTKTRDEWCEMMEGTDICFAPVLDFVEAKDHPHNKARETFIDIDGAWQPAPAPRFSRTASQVQSGPTGIGTHTEDVLKSKGFSAEEIESLKKVGAV